eukprot:Macronucleus_6121.p1 GENE.Macronucleus_6121~~Macronucleus_6121.p1  ORF type:complete len:159 (+),score=49.50 Macronucleus_6121:1-477(+)
MRALGFVYDKKKVKELMEQADKDGSGQIDQDEFKALMARYISQRNPKDELAKAFKMYDDDDNGTISEENLVKVAQELEQEVTEDEIRLMLKIGDRLNRYGGEEVDFDDFMYIMRQANLYTDYTDLDVPPSEGHVVPAPKVKEEEDDYGDQKLGEMGLV